MWPCHLESKRESTWPLALAHHLEEREGAATYLKKGERGRRATCAFFWGALALTLCSLGVGAKPLFMWLGPYGLLLLSVHMHACLHAINCLSILCTQWGEIFLTCLWVMVPCIHAPMLKGSFICHIPLLSVLAMHACLHAILFIIF